MKKKMGFTSALLTCAALLAATASRAAAPASNLGVLTPQSDWKVGTVTSRTGGDYCAMVGNFEGGVVLAVSSQGREQGSLAVDFRRPLFNDGAQYVVTLTAEGAAPRSLFGRATSDHSLVVETGADPDLYTALNAGGRLALGLDGLDVGFALRNFYGSFAALKQCADTLARNQDGPAVAAAPVTDVDKAPLSRVAGGDLPLKSKSARPQESLGGSRVAELESARALLEHERAELTARIGVQDKQTKLLEAALKAKEQELAEKNASTVDAAKLAALQSEMTKMKSDHAAEVGALQAQLAAKTAQATELEKQLSGVDGTRFAALENAVKSKAELESKSAGLAGLLKAAEDKIAGLQARLAEALQAKDNALALLDKTKTDLEAKLADALRARDSALASADKTKSDLDARLAGLSDAGRRGEERAASLKKNVAELESKMAGLNAAVQAGAEKSAHLERRLTDSDEEKKSLRRDLDAARQTAALAQSARDQAVADLAAFRAQLSGLENELVSVKLEKKDLSARLTSQQKQARLVSAGLAPPPLPQRAPVASAAMKAPAAPAVQGHEGPAVAAAPVAPVEKTAEKDVAVPTASAAPLAADAAPQDFLQSIVAQHVGPGQPAVPAVAVPAVLPASASARGATVTLETLLRDAGIPVTDFVAPEPNAANSVSRWTTGQVSGLYEQLPPDGDFNTQVMAYLNRYREDCAGSLDIRLAPSETSASGSVAAADVECPLSSNAYAASFVFLRDGNGFSAISHTTHRSQKAQLDALRDRVAGVLKSAAAFRAPQVLISRSAAPMKFNLQPVSKDDIATTAPADLNTVVIR